MTRSETLKIYLTGMFELVSCAFILSTVAVLPVHAVMDCLGQKLDHAGALRFIWSSIVLMALWPGQTFWTITRATANHRQHSIIGRPTPDDQLATVRTQARCRVSASDN